MANPVFNGLTAYVQEQRLPLIKEAVLKAKSASLFNLQTDIKTSAALNLLSTAVEFGDGLTCKRKHYSHTVCRKTGFHAWECPH